MPQCWGTVALVSCLTSAVLASCYQPPDACRIRCSETSGCPGDMTCIEGYCRPGDPEACAEPPVEWAQISTGGFHACGVSTYSDLLCWGSNTRGQLGLGSSVDQALEATRIDDSKWLAVATGALHTCALRADSSIACWGENADGQVKGEKGTQFVSPTTVTFDPARTPPGTFQQVSAGLRHTCAIGEGQLWCWGHEQQVGVAATFATRIGTLDSWRAVSAGFDHTCAISNGELYCWGNNDRGQVNEPRGNVVAMPARIDINGLTVLAVSAGDQTTCAIAGATADATTGQLWCWGRNDRSQLDDTNLDGGTPKRMGTLDTWDRVEVGFGIACATSAGMVSCWGRAQYGGLGNGLWSDERTIDKASMIGTADDVSLGLRTSTGAPAGGGELGCLRLGTALSCWGQNAHGELGLGMIAQRNTPVQVPPPEGATWNAVWGGDNHVCAGTSAGELYCWGGDYASQISAGIARGLMNPCLPTEPCNYARPTKAPSDIARFDDVVTGNTYTCVRDGISIKCWGQSSDGALGAALDRGFADVLAPNGSDWTKLWGGNRGNCGLTTMGRVACWGYFANATANRPQVQMSQEIHDIADARFGDDLLCLLRTSDNARVCWGRNSEYQLGDGTNIYSTLPKVLDVQTVAGVSVYGAHGCAVTLAGGVACWGTNYRGESNTPTSTQLVMSPRGVEGPAGPLTGCTKVAVGREHSCALCDGKIICWGEDFYGATGVPDTSAADHLATPIDLADETFMDVVARAFGGCGLTADGKIYCWGDSTHGANGDGGQSRNLPTDITTRF